jgi:hypothetical protein
MKQTVMERLLETPIPIDRVAARVFQGAHVDNKWAPQHTRVKTRPFSNNIIPMSPIPNGMQKEIIEAIKNNPRRSRMVVVGYAKKQGAKDKPAKWVVRCDCGNYETRNRILRWLGTDAFDACTECRDRMFRTREGKDIFDREPAARKTCLTNK